MMRDRRIRLPVPFFVCLPICLSVEGEQGGNPPRAARRFGALKAHNGEDAGDDARPSQSPPRVSLHVSVTPSPLSSIC
jgi:hypothetical protein